MAERKKSVKKALKFGGDELLDDLKTPEKKKPKMVPESEKTDPVSPRGGNA
jgi:hypothetical protein